MSLKVAFNTALTWNQFIVMIEKEEEVASKELAESSDSTVVFRAQGKLAALKRVRRFKEVLNARSEA